MNIIRAHIRVEGRVQGVGYRANTRRIANHLGLKGWVRNLRDGRVEILAEGDEEMIDFTRKWDFGSLKDYVQIEESAHMQEHSTDIQVPFLQYFYQAQPLLL